MAKRLTLADVLKAQVVGLRKLDNQTLSKLEPALRLAESNLTDQLNQWEGSEDFSYVQRQQSLRSVRSALNHIDKIMYEQGERAARLYNRYGIDQASNELATIPHVMPVFNREVVALDQNDFLLNTYMASIENYSAQTRVNVSNALTQAVLQKRAGYEVKEKIHQFLQLKRWKAQRIMRTEMHRIYNQSKLMSYQEYEKESGKKVLKALFHPMDNRTGEDSIELSEKDPKIPLNEPFRFTYRYTRKDGSVRVEKRVFMSPPDRVNDRSSLYVIVE